MTGFDRTLLLAWLLNAYDAGITVFGAGHLGAAELNPLMSLCLSISVVGFFVVKLGVMTAICCVLRRREKRRRKMTWAVLLGILAAFVVVCAWNTYVVAKLVAAG